MRKTVFSFPDWINSCVVDDALFAHAYDHTPDHKRALLKTCIARLYDWYGPRKDRGGRVQTRWRGGFDTVHSYEPVDFALVCFDGSMLSPAQLLAGLVPAMASGVENILAVRIGSKALWQPSLLTSLELAGQELVVDMDVEQWAALASALSASGHSGIIIDLTGDGEGTNAAGSMAWYRPAFGRTAAVWMEEEHSFDLDALAFAYPDTTFMMYGAEVPFPGETFLRGGHTVQMFLEGIEDVAFATTSLTEKALKSAKLVLGPGQEGCWVWPDLHSELFQLHRVVWTNGA